MNARHSFMACECGHSHLVEPDGRVYSGCVAGDPMFNGCRCEVPRPIAVQPTPSPLAVVQPESQRLLKLEAENSALKSALAATQERLAQMERDEDMRRTLNR